MNHFVKGHIEFIDTVFQDIYCKEYTGEFLDGRFHGYGKQIMRDGKIYTGNFFKGRWDGIGDLKLSDGVLI